MLRSEALIFRFAGRPSGQNRQSFQNATKLPNQKRKYSLSPRRKLVKANPRQPAPNLHQNQNKRLPQPQASNISTVKLQTGRQTAKTAKQNATAGRLTSGRQLANVLHK